jgi:sulfatase maturation enzyme AslB (radical SAM superfamily)
MTSRPLEDLIRQVDGLDDVENVVLLGGEPTLHDDLVPVISYARKRGAKRVKLVTNGRRLSDMDFLAGLVEAGCRVFEVKLEGASPEVHERATGIPHSFGETLQGIENLSALRTAERDSERLFMAVRTGVTGQNLGELIPLVSMLGAFGLDCMTLARKSFDFSIREGSQWVANAMKVATLNRLWSQCEGFPPCLMNGCERHVAECLDVRYRPGEKPKGCHKCVYEPFCEGPSREYIQKNGSKEFKAVSASPYLEDMKRLHTMRFPHGQP